MSNVGDWSSKGTPIRCPKCGESDATLIETRIYDKVTHVIHCSVCAYQPKVDVSGTEMTDP